MEQIVESKAKCPKCKSTSLILIEVWNGHEITWLQTGGKFDRKDGNIEPGDPVRVEAACLGCDHHWTIRKALQIDDVIKDTNN